MNEPIAEHTLKRFFAEPPGDVETELSPSYGNGFTMQELLALRPGAQDTLLGIDLAHYTEDLGQGELKEKIAGLYGEDVRAEDCLVLSGVDPVILYTLSALVSPGQKVDLQSPEYNPLRNVAAWRGADVRSWRPSLTDDGQATWSIEETAGADIVVATVPHSPLATTPAEEWLRALARSTEARGQTLIVDEIYRGIDLTEDGTGVLPSACELSPKAVVFGGLAKTYGLPGLRIGWLVCRDPATLRRIESFSMNGNTNLCAPTWLLGSIALEHTAQLLGTNARIARENLAAISAFVERSGGLFCWSKPTSGLIVWLSWHGPGTAKALAESVLAEERILVADGTLFGLDDDLAPGGGVRLGLGPVDVPARLQLFERAVARYVEACKATRA
jgi:aspartate/methionine/tyrosine aminotransferase